MEEPGIVRWEGAQLSPACTAPGLGHTACIARRGTQVKQVCSAHLKGCSTSGARRKSTHCARSSSSRRQGCGPWPPAAPACSRSYAACGEQGGEGARSAGKNPESTNIHWGAAGNWAALARLARQVLTRVRGGQPCLDAHKLVPPRGVLVGVVQPRQPAGKSCSLGNLNSVQTTAKNQERQKINRSQHC